MNFFLLKPQQSKNTIQSLKVKSFFILFLIGAPELRLYYAMVAWEIFTQTAKLILKFA